MRRISAILVAAGSGSRMGSAIPKPYLRLGNHKVIEHALTAFIGHEKITGDVCVVVNPDHRQYYEGLNCETIAGGAARHDSVGAALDYLATRSPPDLVLIHDAARPFVSAELIDRVIDGLKRHKAVIPAVALVDTIKQVDNRGTVQNTLPREQLRAIQTPQGYDYRALCQAYHDHSTEGITDDAMLMERAGHEIQTVEGDTRNRKLTEPADWEQMQAMITSSYRSSIGQGYDVHALIEDEARPLMIGGINIVGAFALDGHSDADVALHALVDALLGAIGQGDIGTHFPPSEDRWKNADSALFVREALRLLQHHGGRIGNVDLTIIAESPKIGPYRAAMQTNISQLLACDPSRVNVKATTTEGLGFTGRREGIAAQAIALIELPA